MACRAVGGGDVGRDEGRDEREGDEALEYIHRDTPRGVTTPSPSPKSTLSAHPLTRFSR